MKRTANILSSVENEFYKHVSFKINIGSMKKMTQFFCLPLHHDENSYIYC